MFGFSTTAWARRPAHTLRELRTWFGRVPTLDLVGPLTLVLLLLYPVPVSEVQVVLQVGCVVGLVYRPVQRQPTFWIALAGLMGIGIASIWHDADNHKYLITYWCLAVGLSVAADDTATALRVNGRLLLGLCFLIAVIWKLRSPDFLTGGFQQFSMLTDDRFFAFGQILTDMDPDVYFNNRAAIDRLTAPAGENTTVMLDGAARVRPLSFLLTAWTILIETWIAGSFLWPGDSSWVATSRDVSLLVFVVTTYFAATVSGFAWILVIMGLAQVREDRARWRLAYVGVLLVVVLYQLDPVNGLLLLMKG